MILCNLCILIWMLMSLLSDILRLTLQIFTCRCINVYWATLSGSLTGGQTTTSWFFQNKKIFPKEPMFKKYILFRTVLKLVFVYFIYLKHKKCCIWLNNSNNLFIFYLETKRFGDHCDILKQTNFKHRIYSSGIQNVK